MHGPIARHGKRLAVRDFAYKPEDHLPLIAAMQRAPEDVIFCIKAMPHDFYVTFPDNPALGVLQREQWVEYDCLGQFFGWGIMPCLVLDDLTARVPRWRAAGATGVVLRIEWERINDLDALDNLAELNLLAGSALARGDRVDEEMVCRQWLASQGFDPEAALWLAGIMAETLSIVRRAAYVKGFVSADNSMLPRSIRRMWWGAEVRDALIPWAPERTGDLDLTPERLLHYLEEKDVAVAQTRRLLARVEEGAPGLDSALHALVRETFRYFSPWIDGLRASTAVCLLARGVEAGNAAAIAGLGAALSDLEAYALRIRQLTEDASIPHQVAMLLDHARAGDVAREGQTILERLRGQRQAIA
jgi:hypothetical protein